MNSWYDFKAGHTLFPFFPPLKVALILASSRYPYSGLHRYTTDVFRISNCKAE